MAKPESASEFAARIIGTWSCVIDLDQLAELIERRDVAVREELEEERRAGWFCAEEAIEKLEDAQALAPSWVRADERSPSASGMYQVADADTPDLRRLSLKWTRYFVKGKGWRDGEPLYWLDVAVPPLPQSEGEGWR